MLPATPRNPWQTRLAAFAQAPANATLAGILRGVEKESLRVTPQGKLAQTAHSASLGSALKHPHITTDYSEALLEFITDPFDNITALLQQLDDIHRFTYQELAHHHEQLWPASMPCELPKDADIPVARYGTSNSGTMKTIYRVGLGYRYGRSMQTIAGIHYNFSLPDDFWRELQSLEGDTHTSSLQDFKTERYFALIRNFRRNFWLLIYLFGAAPAVSSGFVQGRSHHLQPLTQAQDTFSLPYATSLRMGDLGYQSDAQQALFVNYNDLSSYLKTLCGGITQTHPAYAAIGVQDPQGHYRQLNASLLQIENEFYSSIRPKRTAQSGETALQALKLRGVEYIEVRCVDLNPYEPLGITAEQMHLLDAFLLHCLLSPSPATSDTEFAEGQENQKRIVYDGRKPQLTLVQGGQEVSFHGWATRLLDGSLACAALLDQAQGTSSNYTTSNYAAAVKQQYAKLQNPALTPSAQVLAELEHKGIGFFAHTQALAEQHRAYFEKRPLSTASFQQYQHQAALSLAEQELLEKSPQVPFADYLAHYYAQYRGCSCG